MEDISVKVHMEEIDKMRAVRICSKLGIDLQTYFQICLNRLISENGLPFSMKVYELPQSPVEQMLEKARQKSEENGVSNMSLEEINAEITAVRNGVSE